MNKTLFISENSCLTNESSLAHKGSRRFPTWTPAATAEVKGPPTISVSRLPVPYFYLWCPRTSNGTFRQLYHATLCFIYHREKMQCETQTSDCGWNGNVIEQSLDCTKRKLLPRGIGLQIRGFNFFKRYSSIHHSEKMETIIYFHQTSGPSEQNKK